MNHPISDDQWAAICHLFPADQCRFGRHARDPRTILNAILWVTVNHEKWYRLPTEFGPSQTAYIKWLQWKKCGLLDAILAILEAPEPSAAG